ncbi:MAG TPA: SRPBCC family protein [Bacteroidales bacterium]|jgi:uncharacterized protein YndB with AHSA1/START domain|nr:SRPBCC family protein [Bacteroidales bacterium]
METLAKTKITVETAVNAPVEKVWDLWTDPRHVMHWNYASIDWHTPYAESDLKVGGKFFYRMESSDGKNGFNFSGEYNNIELYKHIEYTIADGRKVRVTFSPKGTGTRISEIFEAETANAPERQQEGWQAILDNFKRYAEYRNDIKHFEVDINAEPAKVYNALISPETFEQWSSVFSPGSHFKGSWSKGSKIRFIGSGKNGKEEGLIGRIRENIPDKFISIEYFGFIKDGVDTMCGPEVDDWQGALENYTLVPGAGKTILAIDLDVIPEFSQLFEEQWPKALEKLKEICER